MGEEERNTPRVPRLQELRKLKRLKRLVKLRLCKTDVRDSGRMYAWRETVRSVW